MEVCSKDINPILKLDYPDLDVIRVDDTYYMISTTMHFFPGGEILRSYDLINWEHATFVFDSLDHTDGQRLINGQNIYGKGMWAASLRYHEGMFYVVFVCNDTHKTYLYRASSIEGPWKKSYIDGFYHDCSLLFDEGHIYIAYGNRTVYITELNEELTGPKEGGLHRVAVKDSDETPLGYEGSHLYKINGRYYLFLNHSLMERWRRTEAAFVADSIDGEFKGADVLDDDIGYLDSGVAQGGIVDTPDGRYFAILFQDRGAVGRIPVLVPARIEEDKVLLGIDKKVPVSFDINVPREVYDYKPLASSDMFDSFDGPSFGLKSFWQFNHEPRLELISMDAGQRRIDITTDCISQSLTETINIPTQRLYYPMTRVSVDIDATNINDGDIVGLCILQHEYAYVAVTKEDEAFYKIVNLNGKVVKKDRIDSPKQTLSFKADFTMGRDEAFFEDDIVHKMYFKLEHFVGNRAGLFIQSTKASGGTGRFMRFILEKE